MTHTLVNEVTERQLQDTIIRMAELLGWSVYHTFDSRRSQRGYPDLTCVHPEHGLVFMELKREKGRVSTWQTFWLAQLTRAGQRAYLVRPRDIDNVERLLRGEIATLEAPTP